MTEDDVKAIVDAYMKESQYNVAKIPYHTHNGTDSPSIQSSASATSSVATGQGSETLAVATHTVVVAHGIGHIPSIFYWSGFTANGSTTIADNGSYDGTTMNFNSLYGTTPNWGTGYIASFTPDGANFKNATVTFDATNITIVWTKVGMGASGSWHYVWIAQ
jgi:hypothetical protein